HIRLAFIPNFFRKQCKIVYDFEAPLAGNVSIEITNLLGQKIDEIAVKEKSGTMLYRFPVNDSGVFFYRLLNESKPLLSGKIVVY
ncbi:MAG TPA: T9SS type A sorting domain-containing protein, partial [Chitinophagales bacterium]|nr:T9SS type A sorting domain-containing protein [Chitinophagales bacterium]